MSTSAPGAEQPESFAFSATNRKQVKVLLGRYPKGRQASAVLPLLDLAQRQSDGWLPQPAIEHVAGLLDMPAMRVQEVASFYTMFNLAPVGKYLLQLCGTTPCWLRGSDEVRQAITEICGIGVGETSEDGLFTLVEVECLGACVNAPMVQINDDFYEDLDTEKIKKLLIALKNGETPAMGPQNGRRSSEPLGGATTLKSKIQTKTKRTR
ncbi:MAG: NADH-quinone oxidoreductase subunit NuoE [Alphaproteobacteria bacterium]|nr:NADH-quinone oxidoreductase subunit NuoE [Alphaproteobacteria bacterium]